MESIQVRAIDTPDTLLHARDALITARKTKIMVVGSWIVTILGAIWFSLGIFRLIRPDPNAPAPIPLLVMGGIILFVPPLWNLIIRWSARQMPPKMTFATLTFTQESIHIRVVAGDVVHNWETLPMVLENQSGFLLMFEGSRAFWVDASWFASQAELDQVLRWARLARKYDLVSAAKF